MDPPSKPWENRVKSNLDSQNRNRIPFSSSDTIVGNGGGGGGGGPGPALMSNLNSQIRTQNVLSGGMTTGPASNNIRPPMNPYNNATPMNPAYNSFLPQNTFNNRPPQNYYSPNYIQGPTYNSIGPGVYNPQTNYNTGPYFTGNYTNGLLRNGMMNRYNQSYLANNQNDLFNSDGMMFMVEQQSREAFNKINRIAGACDNISFLIHNTSESLYRAFFEILETFRSITSLKSRIAQIFSSITLIKWLKMLYSKVLSLLGLGSSSSLSDAWDVSKSDGTSSFMKASWIVLLFMALSYVGPIILWKISRLLSSGFMPPWARGVQPCVTIVAPFDFHSVEPDKLSFNEGDRIWLPQTPQKFQGWLVASNGHRLGLVPTDLVCNQNRKQPFMPKR